jgi:hypothetical protein
LRLVVARRNPGRVGAEHGVLERHGICVSDS